MDQRIERDLKYWRKSKGRHERSLSGFAHRSMYVFVSVLFLSESVAATPGRYPVKIAQPPEATLQDRRTAAERAYAKGQQLFKQGTAALQRQAIEKYEEALQLWRTVGDRSQEALTLQSIGLVYYTLSENQKTLDYYNSALPLYRAVGDRSGEAIMLTSHPQQHACFSANLSKSQQEFQASRWSAWTEHDRRLSRF